ncbi:CDP-diacylglycerol--serine O-phosphatidyltransferase [Halobacteriales archaeon SW_5_70_135]|nr:MAG: CDP-diacylglycerol--serine O-phosphatidyltransferase [Halobacteriales archaeon SW_5_70_135]
MQPRFVGRLGVADAVTAANAALGFLAVATAFADVGLAARLMLLAAVGDGLDGVLARRFGSSEAGPYLDSLADVACFGVAPAALVYAAVRREWPLETLSVDPRTAAALLVPALFVTAAVVRLALYTALDADESETEGVPSTLAATIIGAAVLAGMTAPVPLLAVTGVFVYLMLAPVRYPDLLARDALLMGVVHAVAIAVPDATESPLLPAAVGRGFPRALLVLGLAYLFLSPALYWRDGLPTLSEDADPEPEPDADPDRKGNP